MEFADFRQLARRAAARYRAISHAAQHYAYAKMTSDPVYSESFRAGLPTRGTVIDIGCGRGFMLALLDEAQHFERRIGIEFHPSPASIARAVLNGAAEIIHADARKAHFEKCTAVILFDVLQLMSADEQEELLRTAREAVEPDGIMMIREADAAAGWHFAMVRGMNAIKARAVGLTQRPHYRSRDEWLRCFERAGLRGEVCSTVSRNPLGNVLFRARPA